MTSYLSLIGKEIICECVKHTPVPNPTKNQMIIERPVKITFNYKSNRRTGKPCYAYINSEIKYKENSEGQYVTVVKEDIEGIKQNLKDKFFYDYDILFKGEIYGKKLIGESTTYKEGKISHWSANHGGQKIHLSCNMFALCYVEIPHELANLRYSAK